MPKILLLGGIDPSGAKLGPVLAQINVQFKLG